MSSFSKRLTAVITGVALVAGSFFIGSNYGQQKELKIESSSAGVINKSQGTVTTADFAPFWKAWSVLNEKYVATHGTSSKPVSDQDKVWGAIQGLAASLGDPYTVFFPPAEASDFKSEISGNFEGVGMEVGLKDNIITVIAPLKNSPAFKAGVQTGDRILKIDTKVTSNMTVDDAVNLIRGKGGTIVTLTLLGPDAKEPREVKITRAKIDIPTIDTEARKDGIFVIRLYSFSENSASLFRGALQEFVKSGDSKLILDLRGNPGGYLEAAVDMASWFLPSDKIVVQEDTGGHGQNQVYKSSGYNIFNDNLKMVILVDGGSASASEILSGALSEHGIAKLVGSTTYGKGSVQELVPITDDTALKVTIARWLTPNGISISQQGLKPDYEVKLTAEDVQNHKDVQMDKAVEVLLAK